MAKGEYIGVSGKAKKVKKMYVGIGGKAKKVKKAYIGVGGKAKLFYSAFSGKFGAMVPYSKVRNTYDGSNTTQEVLAGIANNIPIYHLVYCNGYFWACGSSQSSFYFHKSKDLTNWTSISMSPYSLNNSECCDGVVVRANSKYLCMRTVSSNIAWPVVINTETLEQKAVQHSGYGLGSFGVTHDDKFIFFWFYREGSSMKRYTIYDPVTDNESAMKSIGDENSGLNFPKYAVSEDRTLIQRNYNIGYYKNDSLTVGNVAYYNYNLGYNGIVYGNGKFTTGYATSTDGITWSDTLDGQKREVLAFGDGLFIRYWRPSSGVSDVMYLQTSEDGINWTTIKADVPLSGSGSLHYGLTRQISAAFMPI